MSLYELLRGPLLWLAFGVFFGGMVVRVVLFFQLSTQKDKPIYRFFSWKLYQVLALSILLFLATIYANTAECGFDIRGIAPFFYDTSGRGNRPAPEQISSTLSSHSIAMT